MTTADCLAAVKNEGGFDTTVVPDAMIVSWLDDRHKVMVSRSKWLKEELELGPTVNGQGVYTLSDSIVDVEALKVDGVRYLRKGIRDYWDLTSADLIRSDATGYFTPEYTSAGVKQVAIYPTPTTDGLSITALCSVIPPTLDTTSQNPLVPVDYHQAIVNGAIAIGLQRIDERTDEAQFFVQQYEAAVASLTARSTSRLGGGAFTIPVVGLQASQG